MARTRIQAIIHSHLLCVGLRRAELDDHTQWEGGQDHCFSLVDAMGSSRFSLDAPEPAWEALQKLLTNPWFERSWVVQEVMSGNIIVRYGDSQLDWTVLSQFAMAVERDIHSMVKLHLPLESNDRSSLKGGTLKISYIRIMEEFRSMRSGNDRHLSLLFYLVRMFRSTSRFKATNTQDRIYALLNLSGLARNADFNTLLSKSDLLGNKCPKNTPHYHARLSEFFTTTAKHFLCSGPQNRRLDFLTHAGTCYTYGKTRLPNIPSWVPDWSLEDPPFIPFIGHDGTLELLQHPRLNGILEDVANLQSYDEISFSGRPKQEAARKKLNSMASEMLEKTMYRAAKETLPSYNIIDSPSLGRDILELKGVLIDGIHNISSIDFLNSRLGPTLFNDPAAISHLRDLNSTLTSWLELAYSTFHLSHEIDNPTTRLALHEAFERTLLGDLSHSTFDFTLPKAPIRPAPREDLGYAARLISYFRGLTTLDDFFGGKENSGKLFAEWIVHVGTTCGGRVFGITEKGRMGLFPVGCAVGNEVCVFEGIGVTFVLRRIGEVEGKVKEEREGSGAEAFREGSSVENEARKSFYELVGAAYVHGVMDGEAMEGAGELTSFMLK
ncbi:uncharacterized protein PAC_06533 [Phialocephala subalpina]|uniref:Heterokaryon incompatibility domain-containing protein n=1 Tax=Phialocephala subalpina TaxID=576137 RepID=A0A1L7WV41_9HELO|nr:uncharacterized protein PAC_06533 [Phialocephala subalpina]